MQEPQQEGGSVSSSECRHRGEVTRAQRVLALLALAAAEKLLPEDIPPRPALIHTRSGSGLSDGPAETQWKLWGGRARSHSSRACRTMCILILLLLAPQTPALPPCLPASRTPADLFSLASTHTTGTAKGARGTREEQQWKKDTEMQPTAPTGATLAGLSIRTKALSGRGFLLRALEARPVSTPGAHGAACARIAPRPGPAAGNLPVPPRCQTSAVSAPGECRDGTA